LGAFVGLLVVGLMAGLMATPAGAVVLQSAGTIRVKAEQLGILNHYVAFAIFLSFVNSAVEEFYWRWFVYGQLRRLLPGWRAHALAGAAFAAHHVVVVTQFFPIVEALSFGVAVGLGGVIMSVLYERQRTICGAWVCHLVVDLGIMGIGYGVLFY
jgi:membrane protease YdiL (CAAX protease family)